MQDETQNDMPTGPLRSPNHHPTPTPHSEPRFDTTSDNDTGVLVRVTGLEQRYAEALATVSEALDSGADLTPLLGIVDLDNGRALTTSQPAREMQDGGLR